MILNQLRDLVKKETQSLREKNDPAHQASHFSKVELTGMYINELLDLQQAPHLIMLVAWYHDLWVHEGRDNHHERAYHEVLSSTSPVFLGLSSLEREMVADGCRYHRASYQGEYPHLFAELMAAADREMPMTAQALVHRSVRYYEFHHPNLSAEDVHSAALQHVKEKFGTGGYARYPDLYRRAFGDQLEKRRVMIDQLS